MTRIDFYQLDAQSHNADRVVCQLCQKAYDNSKLTLLLTENTEHTVRLDKQLWIFTDDSFVPHDTDQCDDFETPILIRHTAPADCERQLLINLNPQIPDNFAQYERIIELVTEENRTQAREHYSFYRERGYPLNHHHL